MNARPKVVTERTLLIGLLEAHVGIDDDPVLSAFLEAAVLPALRALPASTELDKARAQLGRAREVGLTGMIAFYEARVAELEAQEGT